MRTYTYPLIDENEKNPFYCPTVSATAYLKSVRRRLRRDKNARKARSKTGNRNNLNDRKHEDLLLSFAGILDQALASNLTDSDDDSDFSPAKFFAPLDYSIPAGYQHRSTDSSVQEDAPGIGRLYAIPTWEQHHPEGIITSQSDESSQDRNSWTLASNKVPTIQQSHASALNKRKRVAQCGESGLEDFSDFRGPPKHARSFQSVNESSFDISVRRTGLPFAGNDVQDSPAPTLTGIVSSKPDQDGRRTNIIAGGKDVLVRRIRALEDELYGPLIDASSPSGIKPLLYRLDQLLPGVRLKERLSNLGDLKHQGIVDFLALNGYLNARILTLFRASKIQRLSLTQTLLDQNGLNLRGNDSFTVLSKPNSFRWLSELSLSGALIQDSDIIHIHHLPKLSTLLLNNTGIGNETIFLLTALKRTLTQLSIAYNTLIDNDAVPALLLLSNLSLLSILDTNIDMVGLRRLARTTYDEDRLIDIEIPFVCERYVENMHTQYLLYPSPPLITKPGICNQLSVAALKRNLAAHAAQNPAIVAAGTKQEMADRLRSLLEVRELDMLVRGMIRESEGEE